MRESARTPFFIPYNFIPYMQLVTPSEVAMAVRMLVAIIKLIVSTFLVYKVNSVY